MELCLCVWEQGLGLCVRVCVCGWVEGCVYGGAGGGAVFVCVCVFGGTGMNECVFERKIADSPHSVIFLQIIVVFL